MDEVLFEYKGKVFSEQPRNTYCYAEYTQGRVRFMKLRKVNQAPFIFLAVISLIFIIMTFTHTKSMQEVQGISTVRAKGAIIQLNLKNDIANECTVDIKLMNGNDVICVIEDLEPGSEVGNVWSQKVLEPGSYMCKLIYTIPNKQIRNQYTSNVLLVVE